MQSLKANALTVNDNRNDTVDYSRLISNPESLTKTLGVELCARSMCTPRFIVILLPKLNLHYREKYKLFKVTEWFIQNFNWIAQDSQLIIFIRVISFSIP